MAWTAPVTFVASQPLTAAQLNAALRDNMNETAPALATLAASYFASVDTNLLAERRMESAYVSEVVTTTSASFVALTGPSVEVTHSGSLLAVWNSRLHNTANIAATNTANVSCEVVGQTSASLTWALRHPSDDSDLYRAMSFHMFSGMTPGTHTVRMMYSVIGGGPANFHQRELIVFPF